MRGGFERGSIVGQNIPRLDGINKVIGRALFVDDIQMPDMWHGAVVRTTIPHGRVKSITLDPSFDWKGVVVADAHDIPGKNCVQMIEDDVPLIVTEKVMHVGEAVLLIAAPTRELAYGARNHVSVTYEELTPILTLEDAKLARVKIRNDDNIIAKYTIAEGDVAKGFKLAHIVVEGTYKTGHQEHMYIETQGVIASPTGDGGFNIIGSLQCPYYVLKALEVILNLPADKISVRQSVVGGAFGGKEDYPSILAGYCAVLARKAGHPVKIVYDRTEDTLVTTKRHPAIVSHRTGVRRDGTITAMEIGIEMDAGAYATMTPVVLSRAIIHSAGPYRCENILAKAKAHATNTPPNGAFRGFGTPQVMFALEVHMDKVATQIGMSPLEFRRKNSLRAGDSTATGQILKKDVGGPKVIEEVARRSEFEQKRKEFSKNNGSRMRRGIGMSFFFHGTAFTGSGEARLKGKAGLKLDPDGKIAVLTSCTEMGQGAHTVLLQIAADCLDVDISRLRIETPDTKLVPDSGPTVASRTTFVVGSVIEKCAKEIRTKLSNYAAENLPTGKRKKFAITEQLIRGYIKDLGPLTVIDSYELPPHIKWDDAKHRGDAYPVFAWGADVAEVEVDIGTFEFRVVRMWLVQDAGRAINPILAEGQIEGGTLQSIGWATIEKHVMEGGQFKTNGLQKYLIPTAVDTPKLETIIIEEPVSFGPMGAKGLGELPMDGGAPAIANAIAHATGIRISELPITPERLYEAWVKNGPPHPPLSPEGR